MRIYSTTHVQHVRFPVEVHEQYWVLNKGGKEIPYKIAEAVAISAAIIEIALARMTLERYMDPGDDIAMIHDMVFRNPVVRKSCKTIHQGKDPKDTDWIKAVGDLREAFAGPPKGSKYGGHINLIRQELETILQGLGTSPLIIKVNDKKRKHDQHALRDFGEELPLYYRGLVKEWTELAGSKRVERRGNIEIGFQSFRTNLFIPRIIIHEGAHRFCGSKDGEGGYSGYWKSDYSDYLNPKGTTPVANADSIAVFAWALAQDRIGVSIPGLFNSLTASRWKP